MEVANGVRVPFSPPCCILALTCGELFASQHLVVPCPSQFFSLLLRVPHLKYGSLDEAVLAEYVEVQQSVITKHGAVSWEVSVFL